ncbi:hypothetical protein IWW48_002411 [Coemansia sp. RSA 1200]|nr:hypothetical protein IWW48_002411 [Coemansia sp. RSA 1200]
MTSRLREQRMLSQRMKIAGEILETERTYVDGLRLIEKLYIAPLLTSAQQQTPVLSRKEVRQLFANFPDIITLSKELLAQLETRLGACADPPWDPASGRIGDIFLRIAPFLKMYSLYLRNFRSALADISRWLSENHSFARFIHDASSSPECKSLSFQSYLLLPVQRIPRYRLLLADLLKHTPPAHVDWQSIADALRLIQDVAAFVDENIQEHEMALSIIEIQRALGLKESLLVPGRRLVKAGVLTKICRKSHQQRSFYLFSDVLLYSNGPAPLMEEQSGHRKVPLEDCKVMDVPDTHDCRNQFTVISREKSFIVYAANRTEKVVWMQALAAAVTERRAACQTLQMDNSLKRRIARTRRSTMMHFPRVAENFDAPVWDPDESAGRCYICFRDFTLFVRRHHCRACGKIVCNACSRKNIVFVGSSTAEAKEGRGCDQCIARLFGREALESPPGTIHRLLSRSRHSLDPGSLIQSLSTLTAGSGSVRVLPADARPSIPWTMARARNSSIDERDLDHNASRAVAEESTCASHAFRETDATTSGSFTQSPASSTSDTTPETSRTSMSSPPSPPSPTSSSIPRPACLSLAAAAAGRASKHASTGSVPEWDPLQASARSTLLYDASSPAMVLRAADPGSPGSSAARTNRASLVSSSCSTIVSDSYSSVRFGRSHTRRLPLFVGEDALGSSTELSASSLGASQDAEAASSVAAVKRNARRRVGGGGSHSSILALYENTALTATSSQPSLVSPLAPPKLSLVLAEAIRARTRGSSFSATATSAAARSDRFAANNNNIISNNPTLCSLCHSDFNIQDSQHQCTSCLSLVCSACLVVVEEDSNCREDAISSSSDPNVDVAAAAAATASVAPPPNFARVLSMYIPSGYSGGPGGDLCKSCAHCPGGDNEDDELLL